MPSLHEGQIVAGFQILNGVAETDLSEVYESRDSQGRKCCFKIFKQRGSQSLDAAALKFRYEGNILSQIRSPHVVKVYEVGEQGGRPYISLEWIEGQSLTQAISEGGVSAVDVLGIFSQVCEGLSAIHGLGLLHLDLKPDNIMLTKQGDNQILAKIVDFGFAGSKGNVIQGLMGTPRYISPEQAGLLKMTIDVPADLYSLGIALYESMTHQLPFDDMDPRMVLQAHLEQRPRPPSKVKSGLHPLLDRIVLKLLEKNPHDRYQTARGLANDINILIERMRSADSTSELDLDQSSKYEIQLGRTFVGRSDELGKLMALYRQAQSENFQMCFISGLSGMGKTTLLQEFQNKALIEGAHFAYGKCQEFSKALPFYPFSVALEGLLLKLEQYPKASKNQIVQKIQIAASEFKGDLIQITPAFKKIFEDGKASSYQGEEKFNQRIREAILRVMQAFSHKAVPLLILIDDLQWADTATLDMITYLAEVKPNSAVYFVGAYRAEEVGLDHPLQKIISSYSETLNIEKIEMRPLETAETRQMIVGTLGTEESRLPVDLFELTSTRARGNPFFVNEILRTFIRERVLIIEQEQLSWDSQKAQSLSLPETLLEIVHQRLLKLDSKSRKLLGTAAAFGFSFQLEFVSKAIGLDALETHKSFEELIQQNILKRGPQQQYSFYHDKIFEACSQLLSPEEAFQCHQKCVEIIEKGPPSTEQIFSLAEHSIRSKSEILIRKYCFKAGELAQFRNSLAEAIFFYEKLLEIRDLEDALKQLVLFKKSQVLIALGKYKESEEILLKLLAGNPKDKVALFNSLAESLQRQGRYQESQSYLMQAMKELSSPIVDKRYWLAILLDRLLILAAKGNKLFKFSAPRNDKNKEIAEVLKRLWMVQVIYDNKPLLHIAYRLLRVTFQLQDKKEMAIGHQYLALTLANQKNPQFNLALQHALSAVEIGKSIAAQEVVAGSMIRIAAFLTWQAKSREALEYGQKAREILLAVGNMWDLGNALIFIYFSHRSLGQLQEALSTAQSLIKLGERTASKGLISSGSSKAAEVLFLMNSNQDAEACLRQALDIAENFKLQFDKFQALKVAGFSRLHRRQYFEARNFFQTAIRLNQDNKDSFFTAYISEAYLGWAEALIRDTAVFENMIRSESAELKKVQEYLQKARTVERKYREFGHVLRIQGLYKTAFKNHRKASECFKQAIEYFQTQERPIEIAICEMDWGQALIASDPQAAAVLIRKALLKFESRDMLHFSGQCIELLASLGEQVESKAKKEVLDFETVAKTLIEVGAASLTSIDPRVQSIILLDKVVDLFQAERALLFVNSASGDLDFFVGRDSSKNDINLPDGFSRTIIAKVQSSRSPLVAADTQEGVLLGAHSVVAKNLLSMMAAPIVVNESVIGVLYIDNRIEKKLYKNDDGRFLQALSGHIGVLIKMNRMANLEIEKKSLEKDLELTGAVQSLLLPTQNDIQEPSFRISSLYQSAGHSGGDWWNVVSSANCTTLFLGDVTGHGAGPAMITALVAGYLRSSKSTDIHDLLNNLSKILREVAQDKYWMTMTIVRVDSDRKQVSMWFAGGTEVLLIKPNGTIKVFQETGSPLGVENGSFGFVQCGLEESDRIVLYTDGVTEQRRDNGDFIGFRKFKKLLSESNHLDSAGLRDHLKLALDELRGNQALDDDMCIIIYDYKRTVLNSKDKEKSI